MPKGEKFIGNPVPHRINKACTQAELTKRVSDVYTYLIWGRSRGDIVTKISEDYGVSFGQADLYIKKAKILIHIKYQENINEQLGIVDARIDDMYTGARKEYKRTDVGRALKLKMELHGLEAPKKIDLSGKLNIENVISEGDQRAREFLSKQQPKSGD